MRGPKPPTVMLSAEKRRALELVERAHRTPRQAAVRARIVLAAGDGLNNTQIAQQLGVEDDTARLWRMRWLGLQAVSREDLSVEDRLSDAPRPGAPAHISTEQVCQVIALACAAPEKAGRPISQWTGREIADEIMGRGIIAQISPRHAARLLKRRISSPTSFAIG